MANTVKVKNFEDGILKLEESVKKLEQGNLSLEDAIKVYQEGVKITAYCNSYLKSAKLKIEEMSISKEEDNNE